MSSRQKGSSAEHPLELRPGATDRFYLIWSGEQGFLADGDIVTSSSWAAPAVVTTSGETINGVNLTLDGVEYSPGEVTSLLVSNIDLGDLVELENTISTQSGRTERQSLWVRGVRNYSG